MLTAERGKGSGYRVCAGQARNDVSKTLPDKALVGINALAGLHGNRFRDGNRFHVAHHCDNDGFADKPRSNRHVETGQAEGRQARRHMSHDLATQVLVSDQQGDEAGHDHGNQHPGEFRRIAPQPENDCQCKNPHGKGWQVGVLRGFDQHVPDGHVKMMAGFGRDSEQFGQL